MKIRPIELIPIEQIPNKIKALDDQAFKINKLLDRYPHISTTYSHESFTLKNEVRNILINYRGGLNDVVYSLAQDKTGIKELIVNDIQKITKDIQDILKTVCSHYDKLEGNVVFDERGARMNEELIRWKKNLDSLEFKKKIKLDIDKVPKWNDVIDEFNLTIRPELKTDLELTDSFFDVIKDTLPCNCSSCSNNGFIRDYKLNDRIPLFILIVSVLTGFVLFQYIIDWRYPPLDMISKENVAETEVNIENMTNKDKKVFCPVCGSIIEYTK